MPVDSGRYCTFKEEINPGGIIAFEAIHIIEYLGK